MKTTRILIASDTHLCHIDWYGVPSAKRMENFIRDVEAEYEKAPFDGLLLLGDYSLDHWKWNVKGSFLREGLSYTDIFVKEYLSRLKKYPFFTYLIAGNHEQYGEALWQTFTGCHRTGHWVCGDYVFVLLDTFGADLDPTEHSDGTYCGVDVSFVRDMLTTYPDKKLILCAHHFAPEKESEDFRRLMRQEPRLICLFGGHVHLSRVVPLGEDYGNKYLFYTGQYSYTGEKPITNSMWGFRDVILTDTTLETRYITPENTVIPQEGAEPVLHPFGIQDCMKLENL